MGRSLNTLMASGLGGFGLYTKIKEPLLADDDLMLLIKRGKLVVVHSPN